MNYENQIQVGESYANELLKDSKARKSFESRLYSGDFPEGVIKGYENAMTKFYQSELDSEEPSVTFNMTPNEYAELSKIENYKENRSKLFEKMLDNPEYYLGDNYGSNDFRNSYDDYGKTQKYLKKYDNNHDILKGHLSRRLRGDIAPLSILASMPMSVTTPLALTGNSAAGFLGAVPLLATAALETAMRMDKGSVEDQIEYLNALRSKGKTLNDEGSEVKLY